MSKGERRTVEPCRTVVNVDDEWVPTDQVEFLNIEEGVQGEDIMTFRYNGKIYKRTVMGR
jgi:hypothetical protein